MGNLVEDIKLNSVDMTDAKIIEIYSQVSQKYAVYRTADRVMVQFADDDALGVQQRENFRPLWATRSDIQAMMDGWDDGGLQFGHSRRVSRTKLLNHRIADALVRALQGFPADATNALTQVHDDLLAERISIRKLEYLLTAVITAAAYLVAMPILQAYGTYNLTFYMANNLTSTAASLGVLGALFSIALGISSRTMRIDQNPRDNVLDAVLRIGIGAFSAVVLFALLKGEIVSLKIGGTDLLPGGVHDETRAISVVVAFLAGFSERLVGDFLGTVALSTTGPETKVTAATSTKAAGSDEDHPNGQAFVGPAGGPVPPSADTIDAGHAHPEDGTDACACDAPVTGDEVTDDSELPPSYGGVEGGDTLVGGQ